MMSRWTFCGCLFLLATGTACSEKTPCDEDQELRSNGYCYPVNAKDAAVAPTSPAEAGISVDLFGRSCQKDDDCAAPASLCAIQNGPPGFCSAIGCDRNPAICPAGWACMDLTALGIPAHLCVPPT